MEEKINLLCEGMSKLLTLLRAPIWETISKNSPPLGITKFEQEARHELKEIEELIIKLRK